MPRKGQRSELFVAGDTAHPQALGSLLRGFLDYLAVRNFSWETTRKRRLDLNHFVAWAEARGLARPVEITRTTLERYQRHLATTENARGKPLSVRCQHAKLCSVRRWFKWLARSKHVLHNPASELELPKLPQQLPRHLLTPADVEAILALPQLASPWGLRDRAMLEVFYSTGIRRLELVSLQTHDIDESQGVLTVRLGKGQKDRLVPIGARALQWLRQYQTEVRSRWLVSDDEHTVFLTRFGHAFTLSSVSALVHRYVERAELGKSGSCHLFRHAMATAMHDNGADIRYLQVMLGHVKLETTQVYTRVSVQQLKRVHDQTHPAEQPPPAPE